MAFLSTLFTILFVVACIVLVIAVLLQPGKADAGALFTNAISSAAFGPRGTQTLLAKITVGAAIAFMLIALTLSLPALTGTRSVLETTAPGANATPTPAASPNASPNTSPAASPSAATEASPQATTAPPAASPTNATQTPNASASPTSGGNANNVNAGASPSPQGNR